jgi:hypothetical protein
MQSSTKPERTDEPSAACASPFGEGERIKVRGRNHGRYNSPRGEASPGLSPKPTPLPSLVPRPRGASLPEGETRERRPCWQAAQAAVELTTDNEPTPPHPPTAQQLVCKLARNSLSSWQNFCCHDREARLLATQFLKIVLGGTAALHAHRAWGAVLFLGKKLYLFSSWSSSCSIRAESKENAQLRNCSRASSSTSNAQCQNQ